MARLTNVLECGQYVMGAEVAELERKLAEFVGVDYCITMSSGTDALLAALLALEIQAGDEVITTAFSFIATAEVISLIGAVPVFVDIDPATYNIAPALIAQAITPKTKAIMPVSLYGQCYAIEAVNQIAATHHLPVIEDGAQSFGAVFNGKKSCGLTTIGCTSFFPSKPLGCYGDGGACFTNDANLALALTQIRNHGQEHRYYHSRVGINGRLDTLQAAVLLAKLEQFPDEVKQRAVIGQRYSDLFQQHGAYSTNQAYTGVLTPYIAPENHSVYAQYTIQIDERQSVITALEQQGIPTAIHYPLPLTQQPALMQYSANGSVPNSDYAATRVLSLPMHPYLTSADQERIVNAVIAAC
nr:DegT/DnrJ/EryC1/StrS family aminotransferase [Thiospirillum jenense]